MLIVSQSGCQRIVEDSHGFGKRDSVLLEIAFGFGWIEFKDQVRDGHALFYDDNRLAKYAYLVHCSLGVMDFLVERPEIHMAKAGKREGIEVGSGNVSADLGLANAEELNTKLRLSVVINKILEDRKLTQAEAAKVLGVNQPKVSALQHYKLEGFSVQRLMHFVTALRHDVVIEIRPRAASKGEARIVILQAESGRGHGKRTRLPVSA
jgi:predicted XRE-type DNA-binding protein